MLSEQTKWTDNLKINNVLQGFVLGGRSNKADSC